MSKMIFCDLFAGSGVVSNEFKSCVKKVISNDVEFYSYVINRSYLSNDIELEHKSVFEHLNSLSTIEDGFFYKHYSMSGGGRQYFSDENCKKIDTIRVEIERLKNSNKIDENLYYFLIASLIESADKVANTASQYDAFLKDLKYMAKKPLILKPFLFEPDSKSHEVFNEDSNKLIKNISGDILYLDPPYNQRQYGAAYHILNTIALYDNFEPKQKTGKREYFHSDYSKSSSVKKALDSLIESANFKYIFLSYNNEGFMSQSEIETILSRYGSYSLSTKEYKKYKSNTSTCSTTVEHLHILEKEIYGKIQ